MLDYLKAQAKPITVVAIDEAQFFDADLPRTLARHLADRGIRVIAAGLDLDFKGIPFGCMPELLALAEEVTKLHAVCMETGRPAHFSHRIAGGDSTVEIGEKDRYIPLTRQGVCRSAKSKSRGRTFRLMTVGAWKSWLQRTCNPGSFDDRGRRGDGTEPAALHHTRTPRQFAYDPAAARAFVAITGLWHDGHDYLNEAYAEGGAVFHCIEGYSGAKMDKCGCGLFPRPRGYVAKPRAALARCV